MRQQHPDLAIPGGRQPRQPVGQPGLGLMPVGLGGRHQAHDRCRAFSSGFGAGKQPILSTKRDRPDRVLDRVVVDRECAVVTLNALKPATCNDPTRPPTKRQPRAHICQPNWPLSPAKLTAAGARAAHLRHRPDHHHQRSWQDSTGAQASGGDWPQLAEPFNEDIRRASARAR